MLAIYAAYDAPYATALQGSIQPTQSTAVAHAHTSTVEAAHGQAVCAADTVADRFAEYTTHTRSHHWAVYAAVQPANDHPVRTAFWSAY